MDEPEPAPCGTWPSQVTLDLLTQAAVGFEGVALDGGAVWWLETRPAEAGRSVLVRSDPATGATWDVTPPGFDVRTRVHEYGGGAWLVRDGVAWFSNFDDQRVYRQVPGGEPVALTPAPARQAATRYADYDLAPDGKTLYCVRERHEGRKVINDVVCLPADGPGEPVPVTGGHDFYSNPRVSPDGRWLCWLAWDHPDMPWDGTTLYLAARTDGGTVRDPRAVLGGTGESVFQPEWAPGGTLHAVSDRSGWWNLYRLDGTAPEAAGHRGGEAAGHQGGEAAGHQGGEAAGHQSGEAAGHQGGEVAGREGVSPVALHPASAEFGVPAWWFGFRTYGFLSGGRIACIVNREGFERLHVLHPDGRLADAELDWTDYLASLVAHDGEVAFVAAAPDRPASVVVATPGGPQRLLRQGLDVDLDPETISSPQPLTFPTAQGREAHALYYPARSPRACPREGELPPLLVQSHGGPTSQAKARLALGIQFWTSRGFAVVDVNYGGSSGYGRAYRERLRGTWGVVDVEDCVNAAKFLVAQGRVDPARVAIRGGSAGGFTTLAALAFTDAFSAGASYYGVCDLALLARTTHKFEARYLDGLVGPYPAASDTYRERSPLEAADRIAAPVLLLQGSEDPVVPPSQAEEMVEALARRGVPHAYVVLEGEQHGFRRAESVERALASELSFYGQVFGFTPHDDIEPLALR